MDAISGMGNRRTEEPAWLAARLAAGASSPIARSMGPGRVLLALVMIALGLRGLLFGDFAGTWQRIPIAHLPAHDFFVYLAALVELATGVGMLVPRIAKAAAGVLSVFVLLWMVLLKFPAVIYAPAMEATWLGAGEIAVILAGTWTVFASLAKPDGQLFAGRHGIRNARLLFVLALPTIGLSHYFYADITAGFVPAWLPWKHGWAYLTGAGSLATALAILFATWPRLAAVLEAAMLVVITLLVWLPPLLAHAHDTDAWSAFLMSSAIAAGAAAVADSYRGIGWTARGVRR